VQNKKNYGTAYHLASRLIEYELDPKEEEQAQKVLKYSEQKGRVNAVELNYDEKNPFVICAKSFTPIFFGSPSIKCLYCSANYKPDYDGQVCSICKIGLIKGQ